MESRVFDFAKLAENNITKVKHFPNGDAYLGERK
jgi:hypothetical protein